MSSQSAVLEVALILSACVLSLKMLLLGMRTAVTRGMAKRFVNPEDTAWLGGETVPVDSDVAARWRRAHLNDVENFVPFIVLGMAYLLLGGSASMGLGYVLVFTFARIIHSVAYLNHKAILRRNAYTAGFLVLVAMAMHVAVLAVGKLVAGASP